MRLGSLAGWEEQGWDGKMEGGVVGERERERKVKEGGISGVCYWFD